MNTNNDPTVSVGDLVKLNKSAWDILPKLTEEETIATLSKLRVLDAVFIGNDKYPNMKRLVLKGLEDHPIDSIHVSPI